jgi:hypothetical protein
MESLEEAQLIARQVGVSSVQSPSHILRLLQSLSLRASV